MMNEMFVNALVADALREAEKAHLVNKVIKSQQNLSLRSRIPGWVDILLLNFSDRSRSNEVQGV